MAKAEEFLIKPQIITEEYRTHKDAFLWKKSLDDLTIYVMLNHRLSLWCWLQCKDITKREHSLIFIDQHCDLGPWRCDKRHLNKNTKNLDNLSNLDYYNSLLEDKGFDGIKNASCIKSGNFMTLTTNIKLFDHHYFYISGIGDCKRYINEDGSDLCKFTFYENIENIEKNIEMNIKTYKGRTIIDIDLDFFDKIQDKEKREYILKIIFENVIKRYKKDISCITIALTNLPSDKEWSERGRQFNKISEILDLNIASSDFILKDV